jgi:hypothetical protein
MSRHDENPTAGEMLEEILDLLAGLGVLLLPIILLAVPGLVLLLPLVLLAIPFALLAAPVMLIVAIRRRRRSRRPYARVAAVRSRVTPTAAR